MSIPNTEDITVASSIRSDEERSEGIEQSVYELEQEIDVSTNESPQNDTDRIENN